MCFYCVGGSEMRMCMDDLDNDAVGVFDRQAPRCICKLFLSNVATTAE